MVTFTKFTEKACIKVRHRYPHLIAKIRIVQECAAILAIAEFLFYFERRLLRSAAFSTISRSTQCNCHHWPEHNVRHGCEDVVDQTYWYRNQKAEAKPRDRCGLQRVWLLDMIRVR